MTLAFPRGIVPHRVPAAQNLSAGTALTRATDLTGATDAATGTVSFWFRLSSAVADTIVSIIDDNVTFQTFVIFFNETGLSGKFRTDLSSAGGAAHYRFTTNNTFAYDRWHHVLWSFDTSGTNAAIKAAMRFYVNDVSQAVTYTFEVGSAFNVDFTAGALRWFVTTGSQVLSLSEFWFAQGVYLDFDDPTKRRKFITEGLMPANLGGFGEMPTGVQPIMYIKPEFESRLQNRGTGGDFTDATGYGLATSTPSSPTNIIRG